VTRLIEALGLRTKNTREVTLRMAVNEVVAVNTVEYVNGEQIDAMAAELRERQYVLSRWISVEERLPDERVKVLTCGDDPVEGPFTLIGLREPASSQRRYLARHTGTCRAFRSLAPSPTGCRYPLPRRLSDERMDFG